MNQSTEKIECMCPHCGRAMQTEMTVEEVIVIAGLTKMQATIIKLLSKNIGQFVSTDRLVNRIYGHRVDGGPLNANNSIAVTISKLRQKLEKMGSSFKIESLMGSDGGYRLELLERGATA